MMNAVAKPKQTSFDKQAVARLFSKAVNTYDEFAIVQHQAACDLVEFCGQFTGPVETCLDIGCGTGALAKLMHHKAFEWINFDISNQMLLRCQQQFGKGVFQIQGDAADLPFADNAFDLILSNMALQWCNSPEQVMNEIYRVLKPGGIAVLSIMTADSFRDLKTIWQSTGYTPKLASLPDVNTWEINSRKFSKIDKKTVVYKEHGDSIFNLLKRIKQVGASHYVKTNSVKTNSLKTDSIKTENGKLGNSLTRQEIVTVERAWKTHFGSNFYLDYHLLQICLKKNKK